MGVRSKCSRRMTAPRGFPPALESKKRVRLPADRLGASFFSCHMFDAAKTELVAEYNAKVGPVRRGSFRLTLLFLSLNYATSSLCKGSCRKAPRFEVAEIPPNAVTI